MRWLRSSISNLGALRVWRSMPRNHPSHEVDGLDERHEVLVTRSQETHHIGLAEPHSWGWSQIVGGSTKLEEHEDLGEKSSKNQSETPLPFTTRCMSRQICVWDSHQELSPAVEFSPCHHRSSDLQDRRRC